MFGDYVIYVDESGDHSLVNINPEFPVFVLAFCIFPVREYIAQVVPAVERLKFEFFGHDMVVLHERDIRKSNPPFEILLNPAIRQRFLDAVNAIIRQSAFRIVACVIRKEEFRSRVGSNANPYHVALEYGLEQVFFQIQGQNQTGRKTSVIFESRGKAEDASLELEFRRIMDTTRVNGLSQTLIFRCANKQANSSGLQVADMVARPIGLKTLRPAQTNRAWDVLEPKIARSRTGKTMGYGLKVYP